MIENERRPYRFILAAFAAVALLIVGCFLYLADTRPAGAQSAAQTPASVTSGSGVVPSSQPAGRVPEVTSSEVPSALPRQDVDMGAVRATGYVMGNILRDARSTEIVNPDGTKSLDLTNTFESAARTPLPVDLAYAGAAPLVRAEFFAAVMAGALNLSADQKTAFAKEIAESYTADFGARVLDDDSRSELRKQLSQQAYARISAKIPESEQARFREIFQPSDFLFAISITSDSASVKVRSPK